MERTLSAEWVLARTSFAPEALDGVGEPLRRRFCREEGPSDDSLIDLLPSRPFVVSKTFAPAVGVTPMAVNADLVMLQAGLAVVNLNPPARSSLRVDEGPGAADEVNLLPHQTK